MTDSLEARFKAFFARPAALKASESLKPAAKISLVVRDEHKVHGQWIFSRVGEKNELWLHTDDWDMQFTLTPKAAEKVVGLSSDSIGELGVAIAKLIVSSDVDEKIHIKLNAGFMTLFSKGYLGVIASGGKEFAGFLATRGFSGLGAIKKIIEKLRG